MSLYDVHVGKLLHGKRDFQGQGYYVYTKDQELFEIDDLQEVTGRVIDSNEIEDLLYKHCCEVIDAFARTDDNQQVYVFTVYTDVTDGGFVIYINTEGALEKTANAEDEACLRFSEGDFAFRFTELPEELSDIMSLYYCIRLDEQYFSAEQDMIVPKSLMDHQLYFIAINVIKRLTEPFKILNTTHDFVAYVSSEESGDYLTYSTLMRETIDPDTFYQVFPNEKVNDDEFQIIIRFQQTKPAPDQLDYWLAQIRENKWRTDDGVISKYCKTDYHAYECLFNMGSELIPFLLEKLHSAEVIEEDKRYCEALLKDIKKTQGAAHE
jgi:Domain of unknown function (DUF4303)